MKKAAITISAIAIACLASALALTGCASAEDFTAMSYTSGGSVTDIVINVSERALDIIASEDENVHIAYHDSEKEYLDIRKNDDGRLTIGLAENKAWTDPYRVRCAREVQTDRGARAGGRSVAVRGHERRECDDIRAETVGQPRAERQ